jgi:hypothetical protein
MCTKLQNAPKFVTFNIYVHGIVLIIFLVRMLRKPMFIPSDGMLCVIITIILCHSIGRECSQAL